MCNYYEKQKEIQEATGGKVETHCKVCGDRLNLDEFTAKICIECCSNER